MAAGYSFRPRAWALVLAAIACAGAIALGNWQTRRADEKRALGERLEQALRAPAVDLPAAPVKPQDYAWKRVSARGEFVGARTIVLDNRIHRGQAGYEVLTPLRLAGSAMHVVVNRGWIAAGTRRAMPDVPTPTGVVRVEGVALERLPHAMEPGDAPPGKLRQNFELQSFASETGLSLQPIILQQHAGPADGLTRDWPRPDTGVDKHAAYALQWYSLGALAVLLVIGLSFSRVRAD